MGDLQAIRVEHTDIVRAAKTTPLMGSNHQPGTLTGRPVQDAGIGPCDHLAWIKDNTTYEVVPYLKLRAEGGAFYGAEIFDQRTGDKINEIGPMQALADANRRQGMEAEFYAIVQTLVHKILDEAARQ